MSNDERFTLFWSGPFSQWFRSNFVIKGMSFTHAEQWMMFCKAMCFDDLASAEAIMDAITPKDHKKIGRGVKNYVDEAWCNIARDVVYYGSFAKFTQNSDLLDKLLSTSGTTLVEASPYDKRWGIGMSGTNPNAYIRKKWHGKNWLGETLTAVREDIINLIVKPIPEQISDFVQKWREINGK